MRIQSVSYQTNYNRRLTPKNNTPAPVNFTSKERQTISVVKKLLAKLKLFSENISKTPKPVKKKCSLVENVREGRNLHIQGKAIIDENKIISGKVTSTDDMDFYGLLTKEGEMHSSKDLNMFGGTIRNKASADRDGFILNKITEDATIDIKGNCEIQPEAEMGGKLSVGKTLTIHGGEITRTGEAIAKHIETRPSAKISGTTISDIFDLDSQVLNSGRINTRSLIIHQKAKFMKGSEAHCEAARIITGFNPETRRYNFKFVTDEMLERYPNITKHEKGWFDQNFKTANI
jgi:hypothetical protein